MQITPRCRLALIHANESLARFDHSHVASAHLVLGMLMLQGGVAVSLLRKAGLSVESVERYLSTRRSSAEESAIVDGVPLGDSAQLAFVRAEHEAGSRQHTYLGIEDLLLGILAEETGETADLFATVHLDRENMRRAILDEMR